MRATAAQTVVCLTPRHPHPPPQVLIGVISIAFDDSTRAVKEEKKQTDTVKNIIATARGWKDNFVTDEQLVSLKALF